MTNERQTYSIGTEQINDLLGKEKQLQDIADAWGKHKPDMDVDGKTTVYKGTRMAFLLDASAKGDSE